ncbi:gtp binding protein 3 [Nannochloropsis gaditana]|uniref:Gtp binding protein 3 n=1 Tax=Nannochloropsis gaditana TaxID=72520 RepID=W7TP69_9STRA|nr:gtp binding protein 3 [Nannochloropsis gaditana]
MDSHSGHSSPPFPAPRMASLRKLYCPVGQEALDQAIVLWLPGPRSFTGEDTVELHCHGSRAVVQGVTEALLALDKGGEARVRLAEPGEFTERAFANGRMDLTEVEGLADLIAADTAAQRKQALKQMGGALRQTYEGWREELKVCLAHTEAVIDFGDDELDVDEAAYDAIRPRVRRLSEEMRRHLADGGRGEVIRAGIRVAIVGPPNAGKSTMLNTLARRPAAIVSPAAGTTRDVVEVQLDVGGLPVLVSDTAGIREAARDPVEQEGIRRAREAAGRAQLTVLVLDAAEVLGQEAFASLAGVGPFSKDAPPEDLETVLRALRRAGAGKGGTSTAAYLVSLSTGEGVEEMLAGLQARLEEVFDKDGTDDERAEAPVITRARHRVHVERCLEALTASMGEQGLGLDVAAEELRIASTELGRITGAVDVEEVLDVIFRDFCIGK